MGTNVVSFDRGKRPAKFWSLMGPMFASAAVHRELMTMHDESESDEWVVSLDGNSIAWFACLRGDDEAVELCHYWVRPADRNKDVAKQITTELLRRAKERGVKSVHVVAGPKLVADLERRGFTKGKARGQYTRMEYTP